MPFNIKAQTERTFLDELKVFSIKIQEAIRMLENDEINQISLILYLLQGPLGHPIDIFEHLERDKDKIAIKLKAQKVHSIYFENIKKALKMMSANSLIYDNMVGGPEIFIESASNIRIYNSKELQTILEEYDIDICHLAAFEESINKASGLFFLAESFSANKYSIVDKRNEYINSLPKKIESLRKDLIDIQPSLLASAAGSALTGDEKVIGHLVNSMRAINSLSNLGSLYQDLMNSEAVGYMYGGQLPAQRINLPIKVFILHILLFLKSISKVELKITYGEISFCAVCLKKLGLIYKHSQIENAINNVKDLHGIMLK